MARELVRVFGRHDQTINTGENSWRYRVELAGRWKGRSDNNLQLGCFGCKPVAGVCQRMLCQVSCHPCGLAPITFQAGVILAFSLSPSGPWGKAQRRQTSQTSPVSDAGGFWGVCGFKRRGRRFLPLHHVTIPRTVCISSVE